MTFLQILFICFFFIAIVFVVLDVDVCIVVLSLLNTLL